MLLNSCISNDHEFHYISDIQFELYLHNGIAIGASSTISNVKYYIYLNKKIQLIKPFHYKNTISILNRYLKLLPFS